MAKDGVEDGGRRVAADPLKSSATDAIGGQHLEGTWKDGSDSAWVSIPHEERAINPLRLRYERMACVMARMCASLKLRLNAEPRCPEPDALGRDSGVGMLRD